VDVRHLRYLAIVAEYGGFRRAARAIGTTQPNLTIHIQQLEADLGFKLFDRLHRPVQLTADGRRFLPHAQELLAAVERLELEAEVIRSRHRAGRMRLGSVQLHSTGLTGVLADFAEKYPAIDLLLREENSSDLLKLIGRGELDACILVRRRSSHPVADPLRYLHMHTYQSIFVVARDHPLAGRSDVALAEIAHSRFVLPTGDASVALKEALARAGIFEYSAFETNDSDLMLTLVAQGVGIGLAPDFRVHQTALAIASFTTAQFSLPSALMLAWPVADSDDAILRTFVQFMCSQDWGTVFTTDN
jgi:DNA-binding transcriptional LysR family regulator